MKKPVTHQSSLLNDMDKKADPNTLAENDRQAWLNSIMEPIRKHYAEVTQPHVRAASEAHRVKR